VRVVERGSLLALLVSADAFLHHMVRNIVGTVVEIACGRRSVEWMEEVLGRRERELAGPTAPAHGLHLVSVRYPGPLFPGRARLAARSGRPGR
jgi:tRNA pseudouridine38-40 synthase